jgi:hypothetical protein
MLSLALARKPRIGFLRDFVVERSGEHRVGSTSNKADCCR